MHNIYNNTNIFIIKIESDDIIYFKKNNDRL